MEELDNTISFDPPRYLDMCSGKTTQATLFFRGLFNNEYVGNIGNRSYPDSDTKPLKYKEYEKGKELGKTKTCIKCGEDKRIDLFPWETQYYKRTKYKYKSGTCIDCRSSYIRINSRGKAAFSGSM